MTDGLNADADGGAAAFDDAEWRQLRDIVQAGIVADAEAFKAALHDLDRKFPMSGRAGAYLWYGIRYQVAKRLRRRPSATDLSGLAAEAFAHFRDIVNTDQPTLDRFLQMVCGNAPVSVELSGAHLITNGAAALASLLTDVDELDEIRAHLVPWYNEHGRDFGALRPLGE